MKYRYLGAVALLVVSNLAATQSYDDFKQQYQQRYRDYQAAYLASYEAFKQRVAAQWGEDTQLSDADTYVHYSDDLQQRTVIDYADNTIEVERLGDEEIDRAELEALLNQLSQTSVKEQAKKDPILQTIPLSDEQTVLNSWLPETQVDELLATAEIEQSEGDIEVAEERVTDELPPPTVKRVQRMTISLKSGAVFNERAKPYLDDARQINSELNLPFALLMAVMQTESSFNPMAQSPIPAFGLMQIVPSTAGLDVNRLVFNEQKAPSVDTLFNANQNIRYGGNYLALLRDRYLKQIREPQSRLYCMIAAYNTGAGNVATVFHPQGKKSISGAVPQINKLTPEQVYDKLVSDLPYEETRTYMGKVRSAMKNYQQI